MKGIPIVLDKERHLRMTLNAMIQFEELTGKEFTKLKLSEMTIKDMRILLWLCLLWEDPALTEEEVGAMIGLDNMAAVLFQFLIGSLEASSSPLLLKIHNGLNSS